MHLATRRCVEVHLRAGPRRCARVPRRAGETPRARRRRLAAQATPVGTDLALPTRVGNDHGAGPRRSPRSGIETIDRTPRQAPSPELAQEATRAVSRTTALNKSLSGLQASTADIEASAVVSEDGLIIASALPQGTEESRVAAMSAAMLSIGSRTTAELRRGKLQQLFVRGDAGYLILMHAGPHAVLLVMARADAKLGLIFFELQRAADEIRSILT
ncbi:MAG: roadblock/LC7 domain-containing protein [Myxococcales bacterium]|nr:roadblock/LC7 domain-containing protein [Myxococcales bacterium]